MSLSIVLIVAFISLIIGLFMGFLISTLRSEKEVEETRLEEATVVPEPEPQGILLFHEPSDGQLQVKLDGRVFHTVFEVNAHFRNQLEEAAIEYCKWLGYPVPSATGNFQYGEKTGQADLSSGVDGAAFTSPELQPVATQGAKQTSIVAQINDILQGKVAASPFSWKKITLVEHPQKGIVVQVGLDQYPDVDEVPDPEIRDLIHSAVGEWEKRAH